MSAAKAASASSCSSGSSSSVSISEVREQMYCSFDLPAGDGGRWSCTRPDRSGSESGSDESNRLVCSILAGSDLRSAGSLRPVSQSLGLAMCLPEEQANNLAQLECSFTRDRAEYWQPLYRSIDDAQAGAGSFVAEVSVEELNLPGVPVEAMLAVVEQSQQQLVSMADGNNSIVSNKSVKTRGEVRHAFFVAQVEWELRTPSEGTYTVLDYFGCYDRFLYHVAVVLKKSSSQYAAARSKIDALVASFSVDKNALDVASGRKKKQSAFVAYGLTPFVVHDVRSQLDGSCYRLRLPATWTSREHGHCCSRSNSGRRSPDTIREVRSPAGERAYLRQHTPAAPELPEGAKSVDIRPVGLSSRMLMYRFTVADDGEHQQQQQQQQIEMCIIVAAHPTLAGVTLVTASRPVDECTTPLWMWLHVLSLVTEISESDCRYTDCQFPLLVIPRQNLAINLGSAGDGEQKSRFFPRGMYFRGGIIGDDRVSISSRKPSGSGCDDGHEHGGHDHHDHGHEEEEEEEEGESASIVVSSTHYADMEAGRGPFLNARPAPRTLELSSQLAMDEFTFFISNIARSMGIEVGSQQQQDFSSWFVQQRRSLAGREWLDLRPIGTADSSNLLGTRDPKMQGSSFYISQHAHRDCAIIFTVPQQDKTLLDAFIAANHGVLASGVEVFASSDATLAKHGVPAELLVQESSASVQEDDWTSNNRSAPLPSSTQQLLQFLATIEECTQTYQDNIPIEYTEKAGSKPQIAANKLALYLLALSRDKNNCEVMLAAARAVARYYGGWAADKKTLRRRCSTLHTKLDAEHFSPLRLTARGVSLLLEEEAKEKERQRQEGGESAQQLSLSLSRAWSQLAAALAPSGKTTVPLDFGRFVDPLRSPFVDIRGVKVGQREATRRALQLAESNAEAWMMAGILALQEDDSTFDGTAAVNCFEKALRAPGGPKLAGAWYGLGLLLGSSDTDVELTRGGRAVQLTDVNCFSRAAELDPDDCNIHFNLATTMPDEEKSAAQRHFAFAIEKSDRGLDDNGLADAAGDAWISLSTTLDESGTTATVEVPIKNTDVDERRAIGKVQRDTHGGLVEMCNVQTCLRHAIDCRRLGAAERSQAFFNLATTLIDGETISIGPGGGSEIDDEPKTAMELVAISVSLAPEFRQGWYVLRRQLREEKHKIMTAAPPDTRECDVMDPAVLVGSKKMTERDVISKIAELEQK